MIGVILWIPASYGPEMVEFGIENSLHTNVLFGKHSVAFAKRSVTGVGRIFANDIVTTDFVLVLKQRSQNWSKLVNAREMALLSIQQKLPQQKNLL